MSSVVLTPEEEWLDEYDHTRPVVSLFTTAARILFRPRRFFAGLDPEGSYLTPTAFAMLSFSVYSVLTGIANTAVLAAIEQRPFSWGAGLGVGIGNLVWVFVVLALMPPFAALTHLCVQLFAPRQQAGYRATFRALCYSSAPDLIGWIPVVGIVVDVIWGVVLGTIALREVHHTTTGRALLCVVVSSVLGLVLLFATVALVLFVVALVFVRH
jgi:hypothetical protein